MQDKKALLLGVAGVVVVVIIALVAITVRRSTVAPQGGKGKAPAGEQLPGGVSTRAAVPVNVVVPDAKATGTPANVAIPSTTAPANSANSATFRKFGIKLQGGKFVPDTVIVNQWDTVHMDLTAVDGDFDFTQSDFGFKLPLPKGVAKVLEFSATGQGNFLFYCTVCGGPEKGPQGHLIVTVPKKP